MQCAKPLFILSLTLAAGKDVQTPAFNAVENKVSFSYGSTLGLQLSSTITTQKGQTKEDNVEVAIPKKRSGAVGARTVPNPVSGLEFGDVSTLGLQRWTHLTKKQATPAEEVTKSNFVLGDDDIAKTSLLGLQQRSQLSRRNAPPTEDPLDSTEDVHAQSSPDAQLSRGQSLPAGPIMSDEPINTGSLLGLQNSLKLSKRQPVVDDLDDAVSGEVQGSALETELNLDFEDVSILGLQRSVQMVQKSVAGIDASQGAVLGLQQRTKLQRGQAPPVEDDVVSMVSEV